MTYSYSDTMQRDDTGALLAAGTTLTTGVGEKVCRLGRVRPMRLWEGRGGIHLHITKSGNGNVFNTTNEYIRQAGALSSSGTPVLMRNAPTDVTPPNLLAAFNGLGTARLWIPFDHMYPYVCLVFGSDRTGDIYTFVDNLDVLY